MAQAADAIVRVKVTGKEERAYPIAGAPAWTERLLVMEVQKVLAGECPRTVRVRWGFVHGYAEGMNCEAGQIYLACLQRAPGPNGTYEETSYCYTLIHVADGRVEVPAKLRIPSDASTLFEDRSADNWEAGLVWLRGPQVDVEPAEETFACDEPLEFRITLTNPSQRPMTLLVGSGAWASVLYRLDLVDDGGLSVLEDEWCGPIDTPERLESAPQARETRRLAPGEWVERVLRAHPRLSDFVQDPRTVRAAHVTYYPRDAYAVEGAWQGSAFGRSPLRLTCRFGNWADDLGKPNRRWAVTIRSRYRIQEAWLVSALDRVRLDMSVQRARPIDTLGWRGVCQRHVGGGVHDLGPDDEKALAACFRVTRSGKAVPGPEPDPPRLDRLLGNLPFDTQSGIFPGIHLSKYFDFSTPGVYRVRAVLPGEDGPAMSAVLHLHIPAPTAGND